MTKSAYQEAIKWLFTQVPNYQKTGANAYKPGLENIRKLCIFLGNPQEKLKSIHIGGTNGKGSTSNMLASVLQEEGYRVGLFNSPHLIDFTERIKVNGKNADEKFVYDFIQELKKLPEDIQPSFFEFTTVMAFEYFRQQKVDFAIVEVGLGGRLDATNIIVPLVSAITNIALDHQNLLGETLGEITYEKAGIIKPNIPIVCSAENEEVVKIIQDKAKEKGAKWIDATTLNPNYKSDLKGNYQQKNKRTVVAIINELKKMKINISEESIKNGFLNVHQNTGFYGRWYEVSQNPLTICDTAHNFAGLKEVFSQLNEIPKHKHIILGFVNDKKIDEVLQILPHDADYYFVKPTTERAKNPKDYEKELQNSKINYQIFDSVEKGYLSVKQNIKTNEMIFIGGSNFVLGDFFSKNFAD